MECVHEYNAFRGTAVTSVCEPPDDVDPAK